MNNYLRERGLNMPDITILPLNTGDREWVSKFIFEYWGSNMVVSRGVIYYPQDLPGFVALNQSEKVGLVTYHITGLSCEIVTINSIQPSLGVGTALIEAVRHMAIKSGCKRLWLITTNDNINALLFYQKRGFVLVAVHRNALELSRKLKPEIPIIGNDGIPLRDEIELEMMLKAHHLLFLTEPSVAYRDSFIQSIREFQAEGRQLQYDLNSLTSDFGAYVPELQDKKDRSKLKPGRVPGSNFWLIDNNEFIGRLSLRYELNENLLRVGGHIGYEIRPSKRRQGYGTEILMLGLEKARELGLHRVLVTCDEDNIGSKKIIEHNGGKLENAIEIEGDPVKKLRYWINIQ
jgi:predicted acetyltransferase